jgi:putative FmdB family regulatory protein
MACLGLPNRFDEKARIETGECLPGGTNLPLYEYRCTSCGYSFEKIQNFSAEPERECPKCQGVLIRPVTAPALRFEGAGWYVNDYAGKGGAKAEKRCRLKLRSFRRQRTKSESKSEPQWTAARTGARPRLRLPLRAAPASSTSNS